MALAPGSRLGPYEVTTLIGAGAMGEVYRATDTRLKRDVAIKVLPADLALDAERLARFQREAEVLAALNHPNIAAIHGLEDTAGSKALVMELVEGHTLEDRIAQGPIPSDEALAIARQIADALDAAHERGIIHRDLKPANVKIRPDGTVKVLDFGLAKAIESAGTATAMTMAATAAPTATLQGVVMGTPAYMSPEQARGKPVDRRTDVWAFGAVLFEMLAGTKPFPGEDASQMLAKVIERDPDWSQLPASTPARVRRAIEICLTKDPRRRVGDLTAICLAMEGAFETATSSPPSSVSGRWSPRMLAGMTAVVIVAAALAAFLGARFSGPDAAEAPVARFRLSTPAGVPLVSNIQWSEVAISPDGSRIAYGAAVGAGNPGLQIWLRSIDALEPAVLRGTEGGGMAPFFSPDGQSVGFIDADERALKRVPVTGGTPQTIGTFETLPVGMEWMPDDTILFSYTERGGGLFRIPAAGGAPETLTTVDSAAGDVGHAFPEALPDDRNALFSIQGAGGWRLALVSLATGAVTDLQIAGRDPAYSPSGHIVYTAPPGTLQAVRFDADSLTLSSRTPVPVLEGVNTRPAGGNFALSRNGSLVYMSGVAEVAVRTLVWVDRDGREEPVGVPPRAYAQPRVSPDGTRIAVAIDGDIWVTELARPGTLQRVTVDPAVERFPLWSPDGRRLIFESNRNGRRGIYAIAADGRGEAEVLLDGGPEGTNLLSPETLSPDGRTLLFVYRPPDFSNFHIGMVALGGGQPWRAVLDTAVNESNVVISPDGRRIAYEADDTGQSEVYVENFPALGERQIVSTGGGKNPVWSRDGRELYYRRGIGTDGTMMVSAIQTTPAFSPGPGKPLFGGNYYYTPVGSRTWDVSPDGRFLMMSAVESDEASRPQLILIQNWTLVHRAPAPVPAN